MGTNVQFLFNPDDYERRKIASQREFEVENIEFLLFARDEFRNSLRKAQAGILSEFKPNEMDRNLPAVVIISYMRQAIIRKFPSYCRVANRQRFKLITPTNDFIFIKKLDESKRPSNIETEENNLILFQLTKDNKDDGCNVFLGYTRLDDYSKITGTYAVCLQGEEIIWVTNLDALSNEQGLLAPIDPKGGSPNLSPNVVKIKKSNTGE